MKYVAAMSGTSRIFRCDDGFALRIQSECISTRAAAGKISRHPGAITRVVFRAGAGDQLAASAHALVSGTDLLRYLLEL
jgi:hypothetical protein